MKNKEKYKLLLIHMVGQVMNGLVEKDVKRIDSNYFHFVIFNTLQKFPDLKKNIPCGWFYHGPYVFWLDDLLVEHFKMDKKYHQLKGEPPFKYEFSNTKHKEKKDV